MTQANSYEKMLTAERATPMSVVSKALAAFSQTGINLEKDHIDHARAKVLLDKIFGEDARYVSIKKPENLPYSPIIYIIDDIELVFCQGSVPEEDFFKVAFIGIEPEHFCVRTLAGVGFALAISIGLAQISMETLIKQQMRRDYCEMMGKEEDDDFDSEAAGKPDN
jgi:hypothetical protein